MLAEEGFIAPGQAKGVFLLAAAGQDGPAAIQDRPGLRRVAAAAADQSEAACGMHGHGIIAAAEDGPVVGEKEIRQAGELWQSRFVLVHYGFIGDVAAGHHQGRPLLQKQMMQGRIGQHHAQPPVARGDGFRQLPPSGTAFEQQDGTARTGEPLLLFSV